MKAIVIHEFGPPDVLKYEDVPDPLPREGEIRVRVHAATVNRVLDVSLRAGGESHRKPKLPLIPGVDCAGIIDAIGPGVTKWRVGQRVAATGTMPLEICHEDRGYTGAMGMMGIKRQGGFAELVCIPSCAAVEVPAGLNLADAAIIMRHGPMAWNLLFNVAQLKPPETILIMGAGGNLGRMGIQLAKNVISAAVIATAGADNRVERGLSLGADHGINYNNQDLYAEVMRITNERGVDVLYDNIGNPKVLPSAFRTLGMNGRHVTAGAHGGPDVLIDFHHLYKKKITIMGRTGHSGSDIAGVFSAASKGKIKAQFMTLLPLSQAAEAHRLMESQDATDKIVLSPILDANVSVRAPASEAAMPIAADD
jgi:NADPH:quinone reductase